MEMKREELSVGNRFFGNIIKRTTAIMLFLLFLGQLAPVKAAWQDDANARIEQIRKRNAEITILGTGGSPVADVNVQIEQTRHSFAFGTCIAYGSLTGSSQTNYRNFILNHYEWAVCENEMKWSSNENTRDVWTYDQADYIADWCADNKLILRGHTLVWETGSQTPSWVSGLGCSTYPPTSEMMDEIDERINSTVGRYAGQIVQWDVDNEMLSGNMFDCLGEAGRAHFWQQAKSVDPDCKFMMNEYSNNSFGGYDGVPYRDRAAGLIALGAPIEAIGIQAHVASPFQPETYYTSVLNVLDDLGLPIMATEFDVEQADVTQRATDLENFYRICFSHPSMAGIIQWGFWDGAQWRDSAQLVETDWTINAAGQRYIDLLAEWTTQDANDSDSNGKVNFRGFHGTYQITLSKAGEATEVHTIQLDPNTATAYITLDTNFITNPDDYTPPTPDPMTWATEPYATGPSSIAMTATTATDESGVEYSFVCTAGGGHDSGWQLSPTYTDTGLSPNTQYTYQIKARDRSINHNETAFSDTGSATTWPPDTTPPTPNPMTWSAVPTATGAYTITMTASTATDAVSPPVQYYFECSTDGSKTSGWQSSPTYMASGLTPNTQYAFRVKARDSAIALNETGWSNTSSATTTNAPVAILGSWATGTTHAKESGNNRALIFIAHGEHPSGNMNLTSVTYGGQAMTKIMELNVGTTYRAYVAAYMLNEAGIAAATTSTFTPTWSDSSGVYAYSSVFLQNVDQTTSVGATASNSTNSGTDPISTSTSLATNNGDMVITGATCNNQGTYTLGGGFTEGPSTDQQFGDGTTGGTGVAGYKAATGANETPSADYSSTVGRQVIIGFVVQAAAALPDTAPAAPTGLIATAGNKSVILTWNANSEPDMNGYNLYRSTTQGGGYAKVNGSLLTSPNYADSNLTNGTPYYYVVTAVDLTDHESANSGEATATPDYQSCAEALADGDHLPADLAGTGDCYVTFADFAVLAGHWLDDTCTGPGNCDGADFEPNGSVDIFDLSEFADEWLLCNDPENPDCL
jgi:GH35 family endo-1,4-beta-xylanase